MKAVYDKSLDRTYREREVANPVFDLQVGEGSVVEHQDHPRIILRVCIIMCQCLFDQICDAMLA